MMWNLCRKTSRVRVNFDLFGIRPDPKNCFRFTEILKLAKGDHDTQLSKNTQSEQDSYEMQVRAANIGMIMFLLFICIMVKFWCFTVRAGESLIKLVSDLKQYLILNDFHSVNEAITTNSQLYRSTQQENDRKLMELRDDMAAELYDLEEEYYTSIYKV